ncbi:MAG: hypothetical protein GWN01_00035 [Nitrosopumilaceae archaeon]|nr:hypothetical protein [Nitrosopumilaceae archaeon]NIV64587.1 hypothetical protein [Nitrosopumilaceae archaeon]NIX59978.1 hypothetical protein [Nitrosopumilaceae archaeon]
MILKLRSCFWKEYLALFLILFLSFTPCYSASGDFSGKEADTSEAKDPDVKPQVNGNSQMVFVPGDAVKILTFPDTTSFLNNLFPIDDKGYIELPIYGRVKITHMTKDEFVSFIKENFRDYLRYPYVDVKPMIRLSVLGGVPNPGFYYFDPHRSLWEVIYKVGGTVDEDGLNEMRWKRNKDDVESNLIPILQRGSSLQSIGFQSGDQIWVKTPGKPGFLQKVSENIVPIVSITTSVITTYVTLQLLVEGRVRSRGRF